MIQSWKDYKYYIKQDEIALGKKRTFLCNLKQFIWPDLIWEYERKLRKLEYYNNTGKNKHPLFFFNWLYTKWTFRRLEYKLGLQIGLNCFGPGLSIAHYGSIVVNDLARIGKNCRIHSCVNIGASGGNADAPVIGDNCYIGPGAKLYGNIRLGNNISIGANAVVNKSCTTNNVVIAGIPAKIVKTESAPWTIFNNVKDLQ